MTSNTMTCADLTALTRSRRSWLGYTGQAIDRDVIAELVAVAGYAPSETNLQPWRFLAALGAAAERLVPAFIPPNQPKVRDAGNVVVVYGDASAIETDEKTSRFYALGYASPRDFAIRNASLAAMLFMLSAHARGLATRPMVGFDPVALAALIDVPAGWTPVMTILIGIPGEQANQPTNRRPVGEILDFL